MKLKITPTFCIMVLLFGNMVAYMQARSDHPIFRRDFPVQIVSEKTAVAVEMMVDGEMKKTFKKEGNTIPDSGILKGGMHHPRSPVSDTQ